MSASAKKPASLRARLLRLLTPLLLVALVVQAWIGYRSTLEEADEIFDYQMQQTALLLDRISPGQAMPLEAMEDGLDELDLYVQAWSAAGLAYASDDRFPLPRLQRDGFTDINVEGEALRVFVSTQSNRQVQVAQEMSARSEIAGELALRTLWPMLALAIALMSIVWAVTTLALRPLVRLREDLSRRAPDALEALEASGLPGEIRPLVEEMNQLMSRMRAAFERERRFVADAAHELRTPLAALQLQNEAIKRSSSEVERGEQLGRQRAGIERATRVVEQLLALARQDSDVSKPVPVDLSTLIRERISALAGMIDHKRLQLTLDVPAHAPVEVPPEPIRQLLSNVLDNAVKFTPEQGQVKVTVRSKGEGRWSVLVEDSGPGIPADERARAFDRFYRASTATAAGSGLGLAIARAAADAIGAGITLGESSMGGLVVQVGLQASADKDS